MKKLIYLIVTLATFFCTNVFANIKTYNVYLQNATEFDVTKVGVSNYNVTPLTILQTTAPSDSFTKIATGTSDTSGTINASFYIKFSDEPDSYYNTPLVTFQMNSTSYDINISGGLEIDGKTCLVTGGLDPSGDLIIKAYPCQSQSKQK